MRIIKEVELLKNIIALILILFSLYNAFQLATTKYPTHSDVFWLGVQFGAIGVISIFLFVIGVLLIFRSVLRIFRVNV